MSKKSRTGWTELLAGYPWFSKKDQYPIRAYSEFMPPPRLGRSPYGEIDAFLLSESDNYGWNIPEVEVEYELQPGLSTLAQ